MPKPYEYYEIGWSGGLVRAAVHALEDQSSERTSPSPHQGV